MIVIANLTITIFAAIILYVSLYEDKINQNKKTYIAAILIFVLYMYFYATTYIFLW